MSVDTEPIACMKFALDRRGDTRRRFSARRANLGAAIAIQFACHEYFLKWCDYANCPVYRYYMEARRGANDF